MWFDRACITGSVMRWLHFASLAQVGMIISNTAYPYHLFALWFSYLFVYLIQKDCLSHWIPFHCFEPGKEAVVDLIHEIVPNIVLQLKGCQSSLAFPPCKFPAYLVVYPGCSQAFYLQMLREKSSQDNWILTMFWYMLSYGVILAICLIFQI